MNFASGDRQYEVRFKRVQFTITSYNLESFIATLYYRVFAATISFTYKAIYINQIRLTTL